MIGGGLRREAPGEGLTRDWRRWWIAAVALAPFVVASVYMSTKPVPTKIPRSHGGSAAEFSTNPYRVAPGFRATRAGQHMGTDWRIELVAGGREAAEAALDAAFAEVELVEARISEWRPSSEISQVNAAAGSAVTVSKDTFALVSLARELAAETGGSFDPSFRPLSLVWRIEDGEPRVEVPPDEEIEAARAVVGFRRIQLDPAASTVRLESEGMSLGMGGIGKGWAAARVGDVLRGRGVHRFLIDAGGDVLVGDGPAAGEGWRVAIAGPGGETLTTWTVENMAVATSGDYARFREIDGVRYSHIIDPRTGRPAAWMPSVTVRYADAASADAYATAASVLGPDEALKFAERKPGLEVLLVLRDGTLRKSSGLPEAAP